MGGGDGMPHGKRILKNIITKNIDAEIAFVCGRNKKMYLYASASLSIKGNLFWWKNFKE